MKWCTQAIALRRRPFPAHRCALSVHNDESKVILKLHLNPHLIGTVRSDLTPMHTVALKDFIASLGLPVGYVINDITGGPPLVRSPLQGVSH